MPDLDRRPAYRLTQVQAADLLGVSTARVVEMVGQGRLTSVAKWAKSGLRRADVERRSLERWRPGDPTWMTTTEVAAVLGVTQPRVSQLARRGFLPYERTPDGRRVFGRPRSGSSPGLVGSGSTPSVTADAGGAVERDRFLHHPRRRAGRAGATRGRMGRRLGDSAATRPGRLVGAGPLHGESA